MISFSVFPGKKPKIYMLELWGFSGKKVYFEKLFNEKSPFICSILIKKVGSLGKR